MLSFMARNYFEDHGLLFMPLAAFVIFFAVFAFVTIRALRTDKEAIDSLACLPLVDDARPITTADARGLPL